MQCNLKEVLITLPCCLISSNENIIVDGSWGSLNGKGFIYNLENSLISLKGRPLLSLNNNKGNIK